MTSYLKEYYLLSYEKYSKFDISNLFIHVFSYINVTISRTLFIRWHGILSYRGEYIDRGEAEVDNAFQRVIIYHVSP